MSGPVSGSWDSFYGITEPESGWEDAHHKQETGGLRQLQQKAPRHVASKVGGDSVGGGVQCPGSLGPCWMLPAGSLAVILSVQLPLVPDRCPGLKLQLDRYFWALQKCLQ